LAKYSDKKFHLRVITPTEIKIEEEVEMVIMRCLDGAMGVLAGHEPHLCVLDIGVLRILDNDQERSLAVLGGIAEVKGDAVVILADDAHWPDEIDSDRAQRAKERRERAIRERRDDRELAQDQIHLRRAMVRIEVGSLPLHSVKGADG